MDSLPLEILEKVLIYLDDTSLISFLLANKKYLHNHIMSSIHFWKHRTLHYYPNPKQIYNQLKGNGLDFSKDYYISLMPYCINCITIEYTEMDFFYNEKICNICHSFNPRYKTIFKGQAISEFMLSDSDLLTLKHQCKGKRRIFLYTDVEKLALKKHKNQKNIKELQNYKTLRREKYSQKYQLKTERLEKILKEEYNIHNFQEISYYINHYSKNIYSKYIKNIGKKTIIFDEEIIGYCLEIHFILNNLFFDNLLFTINTDNFDEFVLNLFLFEIQDHNILYENLLIHKPNHKHILDKIKYILQIYKREFYMKETLVNFINSREITYNIDTKLIRQYILDKKYSLQEIQEEMVLNHFVKYCNICLRQYQAVPSIMTTEEPLMYFTELPRRKDYYSCMINQWVNIAMTIYGSKKFIENMYSMWPEEVKKYIKYNVS